MEILFYWRPRCELETEMTRIRYNLTRIRDADTKFRSVHADCTYSVPYSTFSGYPAAIFLLQSLWEIFKLFKANFTVFLGAFPVQTTGELNPYIL